MPYLVTEDQSDPPIGLPRYSAVDDIEARLGKTNLPGLSNDTAGAITSDTSLIESLIARADGMIDAQLGQVYDVPLQTVDDVVRSISVDLTCYFLLQRRFSEVEMPADWNQIYKDAMQLVRDIGDLKVRLPSDPDVKSPEGTMTAPDVQFDFNDETRREKYY
jgi:phage gp36-like protein